MPARLSLLLGADSLRAPRSGIGRMTALIAAALQAHPRIAALRLVARGRVLHEPLTDTMDTSAPLRSLAARLAPLRGLHTAWLRHRLGRIAAGLPTPALYHEPNLIAAPFAGPTIVTVNDLAWRADPSWHPAERIDWIERRLPATLAQASRFIAVSHFTARALQAEFSVPAERIDVIPLAPAPIFFPLQAEETGSILARLGLADRGFLLAVGTLEPRKNFDRLLAAHQVLPVALRSRFPLAIAGGAGWGSVLDTPSARHAVRAGDLRLLGHVPDETLHALYARCAAFVFPSLLEGFGLPVIEAMASGAPVITSSTTAVAETAGTAALLIEPTDTAAITEAMRQVLEDATQADRLRQAGLARAAAFSWNRTAEALIASYDRVLAAS